jgi:IS30 family transposase
VSHLTIEEREVIARLHCQKVSQKEIAQELGRSPSTICRELQRNKKARRDYGSHLAQQQACQRRANRPLTRRMENPELLAKVSRTLEENWSPEQISGRLREETGKPVVSRQTIYNYLNCLKANHPHRRAMRRKGRRYRSRKDGVRNSKIPNRVPISKRPQCVEARKRLGDWELDLVVGTNHSGYLITAVDRRSGYMRIRKVANKRSRTVMRGICEMFKNEDRSLLKTFTFDNGTEFTRHAILAKKLGVKVYFADPYNSGQRGTNENTNGLVRQYAPKSLDFRLVSYCDVLRIAQRINNRPRKRLRYRTPQEVLYEHRKIAFQF